MFIAAFENCFTSSAHDLHVNWQHGVIRSSREKQMSSDLLGTVPFHFVPFWGPGNTVKSFLPCLLIPVHVLGSNTNRKVYSYKNIPISNYFPHGDQEVVSRCTVRRIKSTVNVQGWLLNIENPVEEELVPALLQLGQLSLL